MWFALLILAGFTLNAQDGQSRKNLNWPCGATISQSYLQLAEASGGHLLLFQPAEVEKSGAFLSAQFSHPQTVFRATGIALNGSTEFSFPLESGITSVFFSGSAQCMDRVDIVRPNGAELTNDSSTQITDYKAGRMAKLPSPEPGIWRIRIRGRGVFSAFVLVQSNLALSVLTRDEQQARARVPVDVTAIHFSLISADGVRLGDLPLERGEDGVYAGTFTPPPAPHRWMVEGRDAGGYAFQRVHPPLFGINTKP